ncbi:hypothetical protein Niako_6220 [Niastella koreensis GR20-10]|uniref:Uncharacterized protein n=1 Tax=Niastella koreensis (strain DSM 17620 / KACC 11465 / NBRC 106392 / GR20-10) TaxID=700598 RepID=G8TB62_NIAKG|nr:hypothetical protein Niako_6220 [Niastella koreensis GR20-10]
MAYSLFEKPKGRPPPTSPPAGGGGKEGAFLLLWIFLSLTGNYGLLRQSRLNYHFGM